MFRTSRAATVGLLLALCACAQQEQVSAPQAGVAGLRATSALATSPVPGSRRFDAIASSPDRGALVNYDRRAAPLRQGAFTSHRVQVSEDHAIRAIVTGKLSIPAPDGQYLQLKYERHAENPNGNWSWVGRLAGGDSAQEAIITFGEKAVFGSIPQGGGRPDLKLTTRGGKLWVVETDPRLAPGMDRREQDTLVRTAAAGAQFAAAAPSATRASSSSTASATTTSSNTIDVLLGYTIGFAARFGGQSQAVTRLTHLVAINNQAYSNSQINGTVRLVGTRQVDYTDGGTNKSALIDLTGSDGSRATTIPASLQPLRAARDTLGADLVALVRSYEYVNEGCGIAWLLGAGQQAIVPSEDAPFGYSIVSNLPDGASVPGDDGKNYFCSSETLAHELAHLMGSAHDLDNAKNEDGSVRYGRYSYSFGAKTDPTAGNFYTVMSYGDDGQASYRVFSNPNVTLCGGLPCGVANQSDNARSLNQTIPTVASFRAMQVPMAGAARNDFDSDGKSDLLWNNSANGNLASWIMNGPLVARDVLQQGGIGFEAISTGDFNGDGFVDIIWNRAQGDMQMWLGTGGAFVGQFFRMYPQGWNLVGNGDVNGDGRDDLIWHQPSSGRLAYWQLDGARVTSEGMEFAGGGFAPIALGDFNGDGRVDLVWNRPQGDMQMWLGTGSGFVGQVFRNYPAGWTLASAGDVDGDGKTDLLWHQPVTGTLATWVLSGAVVTSDRSQIAGGGFAPIATGDFNGDGKLDVVWSRAQGDMQMWTAGTSSYSGQFLRSFPQGWNLVRGLGK